jgi:hypothetical protein
MKFKLAVFILASLLFSAIQARADSVYEIIGTLTIPGNSANPGVGETINYSFELDYSTDTQGFPTTTLVGTPIITSFGPLGTFYSNGQNGTGFSSPNSGYFGLFNNPNSNDSTVEIDLIGYFTANFTPVPQVLGSTLYSCFAPEPCSEFQPDRFPPGSYSNGYGPGLYWDGTATGAVYPVHTPEPETLCLVALGALALCLMKKTLTH